MSKKYRFQHHPYKQKIWKISCIFVRNFGGRCETGRHAGWGAGSSFSSCSSFFLRLSWKNCRIASAHSEANTPLRIVIFGWNGWTGAAGLSDNSKPFPPSPPSGKSLQKNKLHVKTYFKDIIFCHAVVNQNYIFGPPTLYSIQYCIIFFPTILFHSIMVPAAHSSKNVSFQS